MKKLSGILFILSCLAMAGCQAANVTASKWDSGANGDKVKTRCEQLDMRDNAEMQAVFKKYDGWKLIYVSEYTTGNKLGTHGVVCFESVK